MNQIKNRLAFLYKNINGIYYDNRFSGGYWSNLDKNEQSILIKKLEKNTPKKVVHDLFPRLETIIFDPMRPIGLKFLEIKEHEYGVDYGCMWGNLLIYAAKNCREMLGIDQTQESLKFTKYRLEKEGISNCCLLNFNLREYLDLKKLFDFAIVNGVLEWIPEEGEVELKKFLRKKNFAFKKPQKDPKKVQINFLKMVRNNLKRNGRIYLAIENRYDYQYFLWKRDPHPNIYMTSFLPRPAANFISNFWFGRPYVNYLYSFNELEQLLNVAGFNEIQKYAVFPDYRFPVKIISLKNKNEYNVVYNSKPTKKIHKKIFRRIRSNLDLIVYKKLKLFYLCPSIVIIAKKG